MRCEHWNKGHKDEYSTCTLDGLCCADHQATMPDRCPDSQRVRAERAEGEARRWRGVAEGLECTLRDLAANVPMTCDAAREVFLQAKSDSSTPTSIPDIEDVAGIYAVKGQPALAPEEE